MRIVRAVTTLLSHIPSILYRSDQFDLRCKQSKLFY
jgi:hypothetical protein